MFDDTGAAMTAISESVWNKIPVSERAPLNTMGVQGLKTVSGERLSILGTAPIAIQIRSFIYEHEAAVVPQFEYEAVLGLDFLVASEVKLDLQRGSMSLTLQILILTEIPRKLTFLLAISLTNWPFLPYN